MQLFFKLTQLVLSTLSINLLGPSLSPITNSLEKPRIKVILFLFFCLLGKLSLAKSYYVSVKSGNDSYTSVQAQNPSTPWKSLAKLNSFFSNIQPGDFILLNRGDVFRGSIIVNASGTSSLPITISSYGVGALPIITMLAVTGWNKNSNGVYSVRKQMQPEVSIFYEDGKPLVNVATSSACTDGKWWCDDVSVYYKPTSGTPENHIITIANRGTVREYDAAVDLSNSSYSYITIDGLEFNAFGTGIKTYDAGNGTAGLTIQNCVFNYCQGGVFLMDDTGNNTNATIQNCLFYRNQNAVRMYTRQSESSPTATNGSHTGCKIVGNEMSEIGTIDGTTEWIYGPDFEAIGVQNFMNGTISDNYIHDGFQTGIILYNLDMGSSDNNIISNNRILNNKKGAFVLMGDKGNEGNSANYSFNNNLISNNLFVNSVSNYDGTVVIYPGKNTTQINNFVNNTLIGDASVFYFPTSRSPYFSIKNNIIYNSGNYRFVARLWSTKPSNFVMDYNLYFEEADKPSNGFIVRRILSISQMRNLGMEIHSKVVDPLFEDVSSNDYNLQSTSPAIDAGVNVGLPYTGEAPDLGYIEAQGPALPVSFSYLKAYQKNEGAMVDWNMATESNIMRYEVERSANGTQFAKVGEVAAKFNSNGPASYSWFDASPFIGDNYYRLKLIENSGTENYSRVVSLKLSSIISRIGVFPNPVIGKFINLQLNNLPEGRYVVHLFNDLGQQLLRKSIQHSGGTSAQIIDLPGFISGGTYTLQVHSSENVTTQRIKVEKK